MRESLTLVILITLSISFQSSYCYSFNHLVPVRKMIQDNVGDVSVGKRMGMTTASIRYWMDPNPNRLKYMMALRDLLRDMEQMVYKKTGIMPQRKDFDFDKYLQIINQEKKRNSSN